ncbi:protein phosphatase CheZ [uncultured Roseibium sp.]|uniref:protein phosphatase CheZ n=1 Tax=uncultured Roseibium sp. TaxID=1936171 RepID=UPI002591F599|nr:protein phosphatase CheZ [uncultured Roseibium sp.]
MQTAEELDEPAPIGEAEYETLEQTLLESDRGRRFLAEFLRRKKTPETKEILTAIQRLETTMTRQKKVPNFDQIRLDIGEMHDAIERTKNEIANIKTEGADSNRFVDASHELDLIVSQTEGATQTILEAAEQIQEEAWKLREAGASDETCDEIDAKATEIFMACSFQDLTGQRTTKVVQVLRYLESRINLMINIWGIEEMEGDPNAGPVDSRPDSHLLNGPQEEGKGVSQNNVDDMFSGNDSASEVDETAETADTMSFDKIETDTEDVAAESAEASEADVDAIMAAAGEDAGEPMDSDAIDAMFDQPEIEDSGEADVAEAIAEAEDIPPVAEDAGEELDEAAVDQLFDAEMTEAVADDAWEKTEAETERDEANDPLTQLSEAERQALFN